MRHTHILQILFCVSLSFSIRRSFVSFVLYSLKLTEHRKVLMYTHSYEMSKGTKDTRTPLKRILMDTMERTFMNTQKS